jgi:hypothetical protein
MILRLPVFNPDRWNNLNTTTGLFLLNAVLTAFTCGVLLGIVLLCGFEGSALISERAVTIIDSWLIFLGSMWTIDAGRFFAKRKTHQPGGTADNPGPGGRPSVAAPVEGGA